MHQVSFTNKYLLVAKLVVFNSKLMNTFLLHQKHSDLILVVRINLAITIMAIKMVITVKIMHSNLVSSNLHFVSIIKAKSVAVVLIILN